MTTTPPENGSQDGATDPGAGTTPEPVQALPARDDITRYAVYNTTLGQFVGGVYTGSKPNAKAAKAVLEAAGMGDDEHEVRAV